MEFRPTFFSLSGFLIPGIIFVAAVILLIEPSRIWMFEQVSSHASAPGDSTTVGVLLTVSIVAVVLSVCFVVGSVLSELFLLAVRYGIRRRFFRKSTSEYSAKLFAYKSLKELLTHNLEAREAYAYQQTCGLDLHWFAGRNRMVGGSGLSCFLAGIIALFAHAPFLNWFGLLVFGLIAMAVAIYRMKRFDDYITVTAATAFWSPRASREDDEVV